MRTNQLVLGILLLFLASCSFDQTEDQKALLVGHWDLVEGKRNDKITESLAGTYFEFTQEGKMSTNLPIKGAINSPYVIEENVIIQTIVNDIKIKYAIKELTPTSLILSTNLRGFDFDFSMEKADVEKLSSL